MRIKSLSMDNFKSMNQFIMNLGQYVIIAGNNGSGKTTILHALDFLHYACIYDTDKYLTDRGFNTDDIISKTRNDKQNKTIHSDVVFEDGEDEIVWTIEFTIKKEEVTLKYEKITLNGFLEFESDAKIATLNNHVSKKNEFLPPLKLQSSYIRILDDDTAYPTISRIKCFFSQSEFLDLLSPIDMRKPNRVKTDSIGQRGSELSGYIKNMTRENKDKLVSDIRNYFPFLSGVEVLSHGPAWFRIAEDEEFDDKKVTISASQISDGVLRLIAMFSLKYLPKIDSTMGGLLVLDEIEDGINTENLEGLYNMFKDLSKNGFQVIITTHSTVLLDYAEPDEIWYAIRRKNGYLESESITHIKHLMEKLTEYYPGEAILDTNDHEIKNSLIEYLDQRSQTQ